MYKLFLIPILLCVSAIQLLAKNIPLNHSSLQVKGSLHSLKNADGRLFYYLQIRYE